MKAKTIVRISTLSLLVIGVVSAFLLIYVRPTSQGPIPELVDKDTLTIMMKKFNPDPSNYDFNNMELLHIHKTGQVYVVDQNTLRDTDLYQDNLPNYPHDQYVWKVPLTEETSAGGQVGSTIYDASSGTKLGNVFPNADCPLGEGFEQSNSGHEIVYLVYYAVLTNGKTSYVDPTLKGTFLGNEAEFELINKTQNFPDVSIMMHMYNHVCVDSFPTDLYLKDPNFPSSKNDVEYLAMGRGTNNQIIIVDKFDSENRNIGRILRCGTDASPIYDASMREIFACFNSTSSNTS